MTRDVLQGRCLCGGVQYSLTGTVDTLTICHCSQCRRANGSAFHIVLVADSDRVVFEDKATIAEYESSSGKYRAFCKGCGAAVYSRRDDAPGVYRLRAGLIAGLPEPTWLEQQYREDAWPWLGRVAALIGREHDGAESA